MPTQTYIPLANITLSSSAASVTFSSISQAYRDLVLVVEAKTTNTATDAGFVRFNGDSGSNYSYVYMLGTGSITVSSSGTVGAGYLSYSSGGLYTTNSMATLQIMDYSATDKHKSVLGRWGIGSGHVDASASRWANTSAITSIVISGASYPMAAGSTFALYGIAS